MLKLSIFLFSILLTSNSWACKIETKNRIFYGSNTDEITYADLIEKSDCQPKIQKAFSKMLLNSKGLLNSRHMAKMLSKDFKGIEISITPDRIQTVSLANYLKKKFGLRKRWYLKELKLLTKKALIKLSDADNISFECKNCKFTGAKSILVKIEEPLSGSTKTLWLKGKILVRSKVLRTTEDIPLSNEGLAPRQFILGYAFSTNPAKYFTNLNKVVFYKINKTMTKGQALNFTDLSALNLVSRGNPVKVEINNKTVALSGLLFPSRLENWANKYNCAIQTLKK